MQTVYVDVLVFLNLIIDFLLLLAVRKFLYISASNRRLLLGSAAGAAFSLTALFPEMNFFLCILAGLSEAVLIVLAAFGRCGIASFIKRVCAYYCASFIFAGVMIGVYLLFKPDGMVISNNVVYFNISPLLLIILTIVCYFILYIFNRLFKKSGALVQVYRVSVKIRGKEFAFDARVDTGCDLKEPFSGSPVIIAEKSLFEDLCLPMEGTRIIPFSSLGGEGVIRAVKGDEAYIDGKRLEESVYIGFCENIINGEIKALIPVELAGDE